MMNGQITVESEYNKGSTFTVRLVQKHVTEEIIGSEVAESLKGFNYSITKGRRYRDRERIKMPYARVLIVDDVYTNLEVARGLLKPYKMKIDCVTSGREAVKAMLNDEVRYNAIFMDYMMPVMDGIEATRQIRKLGSDYAKNIPIIALTANAIVGNEEMFLKNGFQDFISKPIDIARMDVIIRQWVRDKEQEKKYGSFYEAGYDSAAEESNINWNALRKGVPELKVDKGIQRFNGDKGAYLGVLRSYVINTPPLIKSLRGVNKEKLMDYETIVHGIKGSSRSIFAEEVGNIAEALENAAFTGDYDYIIENNENLAEKTKNLISSIEKMLEEFDMDNLKQRAEKPDKETLKKLRQACTDYKMNDVDEALDKLESFSYDSEGELVRWLRENAEQMNFEEIVERLSGL